ncbi:MAG: histidinol dehydrogenase [Candidatus Atribacteria bacterium]|nr:histidinol dehydrogenase [Candidatus Atribacteria bacterium]
MECPQNIKEIQSWVKRDWEIEFAVFKSAGEIVENVKKNGDSALIKYCKQFDGIEVSDARELAVSTTELSEASKNVPVEFPELVEALNESYTNLVKYHKSQLEKESGQWFINPQKGVRLGQVVTPIERVGLYIPGGRYLYPSSVLMSAVPAIIAGVKKIVACTPPQKNGKINDILLYLFAKLGINKVYRIGGAQAVAALAYGTESIEKVDKIVGPGNIYVTAAKKIVFGAVGIDSLAGPSEITIIADGQSNPSFIAADLLSQSEHDSDAKSILLATNKKIAENTITEIYKQTGELRRLYGSRFNRDLIYESLKKNCRIIVNKDLNFLIEVCNIIAPEHLELMVSDYGTALKSVRNAGAIFLGSYTPVAVGDYICGTNHVIPTGGNARFSSPLGVYDFYKRSSVACYSYDMLKKERKHIETLSDFENLLAHNNSIKVRFKNKDKES